MYVIPSALIALVQSSEILFPCDSFDLSIASIYSYSLVLCLEFDVLQHQSKKKMVQEAGKKKAIHMKNIFFQEFHQFLF